jgi:hypothetical protein
MTTFEIPWWMVIAGSTGLFLMVAAIIWFVRWLNK